MSINWARPNLNLKVKAWKSTATLQVGKTSWRCPWSDMLTDLSGLLDTGATRLPLCWRTSGKSCQNMGRLEISWNIQRQSRLPKTQILPKSVPTAVTIDGSSAHPMGRGTLTRQPFGASQPTNSRIWFDVVTKNGWRTHSTKMKLQVEPTNIADMACM